MQTASKKVINGWAMYDWANSVYNLVITSTIFPGYYEWATGDGNDATTNDTVRLFGREFVNTSLYQYTLAVAFIIVAAMSPLLSSIADYKGNKKGFLRFFCTMGSVACSALFSTGRTIWYSVWSVSYLPVWDSGAVLFLQFISTRDCSTRGSG